MIVDLKDLASECFLMQMVLEPTHRCRNLLDLLFTNNPDILNSYTCTETILSDHLIIEGCINYKSETDPIEDPQTAPVMLGALHEKLNISVTKQPG